MFRSSTYPLASAYNSKTAQSASFKKLITEEILSYVYVRLHVKYACQVPRNFVKIPKYEIVRKTVPNMKSAENPQDKSRCPMRTDQWKNKQL
jgi:hypothetical protein